MSNANDFLLGFTILGSIYLAVSSLPFVFPAIDETVLPWLSKSKRLNECTPSEKDKLALEWTSLMFGLLMSVFISGVVAVVMYGSTKDPQPLILWLILALSVTNIPIVHSKFASSRIHKLKVFLDEKKPNN